MADGWEILSQIVGWIYFLAWNFSFYPQSYELYRLKNASGFSVNFALLNLTGFFFYTLYSTVGLIYPDVGTGNIQIQDMFFVYNALMMTALQVTQSMIYPRGDQKVFLWNIILLATMWGAVIITFFLQGVSNLDVQFDDFTCQVFDVAEFGKRYNTVMMAGYCKALITFVKYCPQVYLNFRRKSTVGWNIYNILLDFTGGTFSLLQQLIDTLRKGSNQFFSGGGFNIVKFFLSICSMVFDMIFMFQHYCLYRHNRAPDSQKQELIQGRNNSNQKQVEKDFDQYSGLSMPVKQQVDTDQME